MVKKLKRKYKSIPIAAKATIWFIVASVLQKGMSVITTPIFTRLMSTEQFGQFSVYNSWLQIFTILTTLRLTWAVFNKGMSKYKTDRDNYVSTMQTTTALLTFVLFLIYLPFHRWIDKFVELPTFIMIAMFAELLFAPATDFWSGKKRYEYQYKPVVIRSVLFTILNALIGIIAVQFSVEKGYARILSCVLVSICFGLPLFIYNRQRATTWFKKEYAEFAIRFNLPLLLHYFSQYVLDQSDRIIIQKLVNTASAGIYSVAYNAGMVMKIVTQSINNAFVPWQYEKLEKKQFKELDDVLFIVYCVVAASILIFISFAPEILMILADKKYHEAVYVMPPVALGLYFLFVYITIANIEFFYNQTKFTAYISLLGAILNIFLNYICISAFGYIAAGYTTLFCYIFYAVGHYIYMTKSVKALLNIDKILDDKRLLLLSIVTVIFGLVMSLIYKFILIRLLLVVVIVALGIIKRTEIMSIFPKIRNIKKQ